MRRKNKLTWNSLFRSCLKKENKIFWFSSVSSPLLFLCFYSAVSSDILAVFLRFSHNSYGECQISIFTPHLTLTLTLVSNCAFANPHGNPLYLKNHRSKLNIACSPLPLSGSTVLGITSVCPNHQGNQNLKTSVQVLYMTSFKYHSGILTLIIKMNP